MINYFLDIFSISAVLMLIYFLFLRGETHHRRNRFYLLATLIASIVIPSISWESIKNWIFPTESTQVDNLAPIDDFRFAINDLRNNAVETFTWQEALVWIYGLGVAFLLVRFIFRLTMVVKMIYKNQKSKQKDYTLVLCEAGTPPASFLHFLFWDKNQTLENSDGQKIFVHERTHIRERHTYDMILTELALVFFWIVPTFYLLKRELEENHEFTADEAVTQNFNPHEYEQLLITSVFKNLDLQLTSSFYQLSIKNRIKMMNKSKTSAWALAKIAVLVPMMIFLVIACAKQEISKMNDEGFTPVKDYKIKKGDNALYTAVFAKSMNYIIKPRYEANLKGVTINIEDTLGNVLATGKDLLRYTAEETKIFKIRLKSENLSQDTASVSIFFNRSDAMMKSKMNAANIGKNLKNLKKEFDGEVISETNNPKQTEKITLKLEENTNYMFRFAVKNEGDLIDGASLKLFSEKQEMMAANLFKNKETNKVTFFNGFVYRSTAAQKMTLEYENDKANNTISHIVVIKMPKKDK